MTALRHLCAAFCLCVVPGCASAAVVINEIAWMGSIDSPNDEWIELYNTGGSIVLDGWTLSDGVDFSIALRGTLEAGSFAVLERTDDTSAPGTAFLVYTGALPNTGTTLTLKRQDGGIEDQVAGGGDWAAIGGDNTTKETPQYTAGGWITNTATPGAANETVSSAPLPDVAEVEDDDEPDSGSSDRSEKVVPELPEPKLVLTINAPEIAYVNQTIDMDVEPSGISDDLLDSVTYAWSFGDTYTAVGKEVRHTYSYPGDYVIVVDGGYARHTAMRRREITVLPVTFTISRTDKGDVQIHNDAVYEVDLSRYTLRSTESFIFPEHTILLSRKTLTVPREKVGGSALSPVALFDTSYHMVASDSVPEASAREPLPTVLGAQTTTVSEQGETVGSEFSFDSDVAAPLPKAEILGAAAVHASGTIPNTVPQNAFPYLGLIGVLSVALLALYAGRGNTAASSG